MNISIQVNNLLRNFGAVRALDGVSLEFEAGFMHGVIGPEGAGKTTLFRHLVGLLRAQGGSIAYLDGGKEVASSMVHSFIAYMPQQPSLYPDLSVGEHLDFFAELYGLSKTVYKEKRANLLQITRLDKFADRQASQLSGGMYKKLGLMCALLSSPAVLLLDEPTNGVDPISRREFWELLYSLRSEGILVILATAYMDEAERCGRVHLMQKGKLVDTGEPLELLKKAGVKNFDQFFLQHGGDQHDA